MRKEKQEQVANSSIAIIKTRDSNIELLRIISMILIILHHMVYHTKIYMYSGENHFVSLILLAGGKIAVIVYILIMGYYSKESKFNIKKPLNIIFKAIIYSTLFMIVFKDKQHNVKEYTQYWFANTWLILLFLTPIILRFEKEIPKNVRIILFIYITIIFILPGRRNTDIEGFIYFYLCGRHILPYLVKEFNKPVLNFFIIGILYLFIISFGLEMEQNTIFPLLTAMFMFMAFANIKIKSEWINKISKYSMGVYLIHDNVNVRNEIIIKRLNMINIFKSRYFLISTFSISVLIFIICAIIDYLVSFIIENTIFKSKKINNGILEINTYINNFLNGERIKNEYKQKCNKEHINNNNNFVNI